VTLLLRGTIPDVSGKQVLHLKANIQVNLEFK